MKYQLDTELMDIVCKALQKAELYINDAIEYLEEAQKDLAFEDIVEKTTDKLYDMVDTISMYTIPYEDWDFLSEDFLKLFAKEVKTDELH